MTDDPRWSGTLHALHSAASLDELWSVLLTWHGIRSSTQWEEPYLLFRRFHTDEPQGAVTTAALLCTDHRWRKASHHLITRVVESGVLAEADERHQLAELFIAESVDLQIVTDVGHGADGEASLECVSRRTTSPHDDGGSGMAVIARPVWPPLRRWAAARLTREEPSRWRQLLDVAEALPSRDGAALAAGVMDAAIHIPFAERGVAVTSGLESRSGTRWVSRM